jgi:hypothetical protein
MPRKPTEKVIEHRITLGTYERQLVSDAVTSYNFKNVSTPIVSALSDVSFLIFIGGILGIALDRSLSGTAWRTATRLLGVDELNDWLETQNILGAAAAGAVGGARFGFYGAIAGAIFGIVGVEYGEDAANAINNQIEGAVQQNPELFGTFTSIMIQSYWGIENLKETLA